MRQGLFPFNMNSASILIGKNANTFYEKKEFEKNTTSLNTLKLLILVNL